MAVCRLKSFRCPLSRRLGGVQKQCGCFAEDRNLFHLFIIETQILIRPALPNSLYRLSCCDQIDWSLIIALRCTQSGLPRPSFIATCFRRADAPARLTLSVALIVGQLSFDWTLQNLRVSIMSDHKNCLHSETPDVQSVQLNEIYSLMNSVASHHDVGCSNSFPAVLYLVSYVYSQAITSLHVC